MIYILDVETYSDVLRLDCLRVMPGDFGIGYYCVWCAGGLVGCWIYGESFDGDLTRELPGL